MADQMIRMIGPDGSEAMVPQARVQELIQQGARLAGAEPTMAAPPEPTIAQEVAQSTPEASGGGGIGLPTPGVLATLGAATKLPVRAGLNKVAGFMAGPGLASKISRGVAGTMSGEAIGSALGFPYIGALAGAQANPAIKIGAQKVADATGTTMLRNAAGKFVGLPAGRLAFNAISKYMNPVGDALLAADVGNTAYQVAKPVAEKAGITDWVGRHLAPLFGGDDKTYNDMLAALLANQQGKQ